jgi:hypothetical protein
VLKRNQPRRFIHEGWDSYLDAIHRPMPLVNMMCPGFSNTHDLQILEVFMPLQVMNEQVGLIFIEWPDRRLSI